MSLIRALVAHVLEAEAGTLEIADEHLKDIALQPRSDLELRIARAMLDSDAFEWSKKKNAGEFKPSPRQIDVAVRHARTATAVLLLEEDVKS